jgi:uncharacterized protein YbjT (DUF2867 family)
MSNQATKRIGARLLQEISAGMNILVTGATGYIGGRLIPELLKKGHHVRVLVRDPNRILGRTWTGSVEVIKGDLLRAESIRHAFNGIDAAYYLVHSMRSGAHFEELDRKASRNFASAAVKVPHVIYLGGLQSKAAAPSPHLQSRAEVGRILSEKLRITEFRAGPIIGSGSASFEMVRYLTERLPIMIAPRWIQNQIQPLAVRDVLQYLISALDQPPAGIVEIGTRPLTFKKMLEQYAKARGLKRLILPIPVLAPKTAGLWVGLLTPIPNSMAVPLIEGILHPLRADTTKARRLFPHIVPISYRKAVDLALEKMLAGTLETHWSGALGHTSPIYQLSDEEGQIREVRTRIVNASPEEVYREFSNLGGNKGWLAWNWAWITRGLVDRIMGGPGLRRGRRHPTELLPGEAVDFWRVEVAEPPHLLRLRAEMKVPGKAWIQWEAIPEQEKTRLVQTAIFTPRGLTGALYGHALYPAHQIIFSRLADTLARNAAKAHARVA